MVLDEWPPKTKRKMHQATQASEEIKKKKICRKGRVMQTSKNNERGRSVEVT